MLLFILNFFIISIGFFGFCFTGKNLLILLLFIELIILGINSLFVLISVYCNDYTSQLYAIFLLNIAAAESSIGLALVLLYYRSMKSISVDFINLLKG
jgi:NADH-quinone oxidoreductase subunit K